jgi:hypothetical protein
MEKQEKKTPRSILMWRYGSLSVGILMCIVGLNSYSALPFCSYVFFSDWAWEPLFRS